LTIGKGDLMLQNAVAQEEDEERMGKRIKGPLQEGFHVELLVQELHLVELGVSE